MSSRKAMPIEIAKTNTTPEHTCIETNGILRQYIPPYSSAKEHTNRNLRLQVDMCHVIACAWPQAPWVYFGHITPITATAIKRQSIEARLRVVSLGDDLHLGVMLTIDDRKRMSGYFDQLFSGTRHSHKHVSGYRLQIKSFKRDVNRICLDTSNASRGFWWVVVQCLCVHKSVELSISCL